MLKQRWVWEQEHGPIPKGWKVVFLDGSKDNFALDNLRAVPQGGPLSLQSQIRIHRRSGAERYALLAGGIGIQDKQEKKGPKEK